MLSTSKRFSEIWLCRLALMGSLLLLATAVIIATPSVATADDGQEEARALFMEGREFYSAGQYMEAAEKFIASYEVSGRSELFFHIGQAYRRAEALAEAEDYLQRYLSELPDAPNADEVVESIIDIQQARAARIATVRVVTQPEGADVFVDDEVDPRCQSPCNIDLDPGTYRLRATRRGFLPNSTEVELAPRQRRDARFSLEEIPPSAELNVRTDINGAVLMANGQRHSLPTTRPIELDAGTHDITIQWSGGSWEDRITVEAGQVLHIFLPAGSGGGDFSALRASAIGLGGASIALAVAAALMGNQAQSTHEYLQRNQETFGQVDSSLVDSGRRQQSIANTLWISSIITLGAGVGLWTWDMMSGGSSETLEPTEDDGDSSGIDLL